MKKLLVLFLSIMLHLVLLSQNFSSENFVTETVDEFGDKTGEIKVGIIAKGSFSNSATYQSCADLVLSFKEKGSWYSLYEYCGNKPSEELFSITFIGTFTKEKINCGSKFSLSIPYSFIELCKNNDTIKVKMEEITEYGSPTTAVFKLFNCQSFYSMYITQFGEPEFVSYFPETHSLTVYGKKQSTRYSIEYCFSIRFSNINTSKHILIMGEFSNGKGIGSYGIIYVDNVRIKTDGYRLDYNDFVNKLRIGANITAKYKNDPTIEESFILSEEQYNEIMKFENSN